MLGARGLTRSGNPYKLCPMMTAKVLCDLLERERQAALASDLYEAAFTYSTAEDLADGMLKGKPYVLALPALVATYEHNMRDAPSQEKVAWAKAIELSRELLLSEPS